MKKILVITEVYKPEEFIINDVVEEFSKKFKITVVTRSPAYPEGRIFKGYRNTFSVRNEGNIRVIRYPVFLNYSRKKSSKIANLFWQAIANLLITFFLKWDKVFIYQTGSIYSYSLLFKMRLKKSSCIIWSQDLWPEAGYEVGFPEVWPLNQILSSITKITLGHFGLILSQSESFQKHYFLRYHLQSKVIYNFSKSPKSTLYINRKNNTSIVYAGNIGSVQNLDELIQLYFKLKNILTKLNSFEIYGDGSQYDILVQKYSAHPDIKFFGRVSMHKVEIAVNKSLYAVFSLKEGPINKTLPSRLQFFYNNNTPLIYLGSGEPAHFINQYKCGVVIGSLNESNEVITQKIEEFEKKKFRTEDVFNKKHTIEKLFRILEKDETEKFRKLY